MFHGRRSVGGLGPALVGSSLLVLGACAGGRTSQSAVAPVSTVAPTLSAAPSAPAPDATRSGPTTPAFPPHIQAAIDAPDRDPEDKALDAGRKPGVLLDFCGVPPGGQVVELAAAGGYTAELLARAVGPTGRVWGQNSKRLLADFAEKPWSSRLAKPVNRNIVRVDRDIDDPFPPEVKGLDVVVDNLFYHDTVWLKVDRGKMNKAVFAALKPGGVYCVIDHSGRPGTGTTEANALHRIDESVVKDEVQKAGFKLVDESQAWRSHVDTRDWNADPYAAKERRGTTDRFALKFVKP